jgi:hypothetical protein
VTPAATEAALGEIEIEVTTAGVTASVAEPLIVPDVALIVVVPVARLVAKPTPLMVATVVEEELQLALVVRFCVVPLLYVPVAVNCCVYPAATEAVPGVTEIEVSTGAVTVNVADPLIVPDVALMVAVPCVKVVASPAALIVATVRDDELHVAVVVRFCVVPLL